MHSRLAAAFAALALFACHPSSRVPKDATLLYDVDFSAPEHTVGKPPATVPDGEEQKFPSRIPTRVFFGNPTVVAKLCGLDHQPLQLAVAHGSQGMEGVELLLDKLHAHYHVELDLCIVRLDTPPLSSQKVQLAVFLDIAEAYALAFMATGEIGVVDPNLAPETVVNPKVIARFDPNKPMHLAIDFDLDTQRWQVAIDGKQVFDGAMQASIPRAVRVVIRGNTQNEAAFDNLLIWGQRPVKVEGDVPAPKSGADQ
jgi:hypothetical protein